MTLKKLICNYLCSKQRSYFEFVTKRYQTSSQSYDTHIFNQLLYHDLKTLAIHLKENIITCNEGLIVLNKPFGLKKERTISKNKLITATPSTEATDHLCFTDVLSYLSHDMDISNFEFAKIPERFTSGVAILCKNDDMKKKIKTNFSVSVEPLFSYLAVCDGIPTKLEDSVKIGVTLQMKNEIKKPILVGNYSKRSMQRELVYPIIVKHRTLSINEKLNVSLIQLINNRNKWHGIRLYCATKLYTPILGENLFASRIKRIHNIPVLVDPFSPMADFLTKLSPKILNQLNIKNEYQDTIPIHLHLSQVNLPKFNKIGKTLIAKPPDQFQWTCGKLNLTIPEFYLQNRDTLLTDPLSVFTWK